MSGTVPQGRHTVEIAEKLKSKLDEDHTRYGDVQVRYDHGDRTKEGVCQPTSYMGRRYGGDATLSCPDIVLVKNGKAFLVAEVEEGKDTPPKTVLGDIFGILLGNKICIRRRLYPLDRAVVVVAVTASGRGQRPQKFARLERLLSKFIEAHQLATGKRPVERVRILCVAPGDLVRRTERLLRWEVGQRH